MRKVLFLAVAGLLLAPGARASTGQTIAAVEPTSVRLEVVLDHFAGDTKTGSQPFAFRVGLNEKASLRVEKDTGKVEQPVADPCPSTLSEPVGTQVETTVSPEPEGRFTVNLVFTERLRAGCRNVNGVSIPVFSNRSIASVVRLRNGESGDVVLEGQRDGKFTRAKVTLTVRND